LNAKKLRAAVAAVLVTVSPLVHAASEQQNLEELRNTVVNLLQALVDQGLMTREKAAALVKQAQEKAAADAAAADKRDAGAVRVPYVPQVVKDDIAKQVATEVKPAVVEGVVAQAKSEGWGVPGAMPEWLHRSTLIGDVRVRAQGDFFPSDNSGQIPDYNSINAAGGVQKAGPSANLNTTTDNERLRIRARIGVETAWDDNWRAMVRLSTGNANDPGSESQTLGANGGRYAVGFDLASITYEQHDAAKFPVLTVTAGRMLNPWFSPTELDFARDLTFDGVAITGRHAFGAAAPANQRTSAYATLGVFPLQNVTLSPTNSKWLVAGQIGGDLHFDDADRLRLGLAYYDYVRVTGIAYDTPVSSAAFSPYAYTAPTFVRYGNTMFPIAVSSTDFSALQFGLASRFRLVDLAASYEHSFGRYLLGVNAQAVRNVGYDANDIARRVGERRESGNKGYVFELGFGDPLADHAGAWRTSLGYRYVQRDAVLDSWTDADFRLGGTNAKGYYLVGDFGLANRTWIRVRYLAGNSILPPSDQELTGIGRQGTGYGVDVLQIDLNTRF
jgi:Putative porin